MVIGTGKQTKRAFGDIESDLQRKAIVEWLDDRRDFHKWFASIITASFVIFSVFGNDPGFETVSQIFLSIALMFLLVAILSNLVILWSIPSWKIIISIKECNNASYMRWNFRITTWIGLICFLTGLTLGFVGNMPS
jgi:hypothetical protein